MSKSKEEGVLFYKTLEQDGIEEIYVEPVSKGVTVEKISEPEEPRETEVKAEVKESQPSQDSSASNPIRDQLIKLREEALACRKCAELASTRTKVVFGAGNVKARLMFVGEAPGRDEDLQGLPFVGRAGKLLTKIIEAMGLDRKKVFIANTLKCRPPKNRVPLPEEMANCEHFLTKQIELIDPEVICALGSSAARALLKTEEPISKLRGKFLEFQGRKLMCTYHPAYLLRNPSEKATVWEDMKQIMKVLSS